MIKEIPPFGLRAYALFYNKHGSRESFKQSELDWIVSQSMKKKIFSLLLKSGWIMKETRDSYKCLEPKELINSMLNFKVPEIIKTSKKPYKFTNLSAVEIWSDYSYVQRGIERSPYFLNVLKKDLNYWKKFFNSYYISNYVNKGASIGEYIIFILTNKIKGVNKNGYIVDSLKDTLNFASKNNMYLYPYNYIKTKYENVTN